MQPWRERRANLFRKVKDDNPSFTYAEVAVLATDEALGEIEEKVRKTYSSREHPRIIMKK